MDAVWTIGEPTVAEVCSELGDDVHYKTVTTVMNRLVDKRVLTRRRTGRAYVYAPEQSREAFLQQLSRRVVEGLAEDFGSLAVAQFVDALDAVDPALVDELERLVRERGSGEEQP